MKWLKLKLFSVFLFVTFIARADEGMWLPLLLEKMNESQMKSLGMKINASDIYSINKGSLKDAIVSFGGFCTGEVISSKGLVLTNHHCGFRSVQSHSTLDNNYIRDGFWAKDNNSELPNQGLYVTFIVRIEDVTKQVLAGISKNATEDQRRAAINANMEKINTAAPKDKFQKTMIRSFFEGNQYYMFVTETYNDVRLVGAPPQSIGNFGQDTDNWMWPRHTGDFALFRIYAGKDNKPADYSPDNVPYVPKKALSISLDGVEQNDFTMVFGFPGKTTQYLPSAAVQQIVEVSDPAKIQIRDKALEVLNKFMRADEAIKIKYAAKYASVSNAWKKWRGEVLGLTRTGGVAKKQKQEAEFEKRVNNNSVLKNNYGTLLGDLQATYRLIEPLSLARDYYNEITPRIEIFSIVGQFNKLSNIADKDEATFVKAVESAKTELVKIYKDYDVNVDKGLFAALMELYVTKQPAQYISPIAIQQAKAAKNNFVNLANQLYDASILHDKEKVNAKLNSNPKAFLSELMKDPLVLLYNDMIIAYNEKVNTPIAPLQAKLDALQRSYMQAQMDVFTEKKFYPDANSTLRVTYGKVDSYIPKDGVQYNIQTYLDGVMEKYVPGDYEFDVPEKLRTLYANKDFGQYGVKGKMPVCFIASNHTTGGNSGSPAIDAHGNLIGLNFDRVWEGTMSDINYDPSICRNIMVDIRYVLFIIDKFADAGHLVKEMKLIHPKKKK
ncbi:S46 family peptidase [Terrimonas rubra]|uniref:Dipeptidyl-peptidase n=1 Tax=Terrimonas rubra TaxID=1035890 RepID=A0ABW6A5I5_9BACT